MSQCWEGTASTFWKLMGGQRVWSSMNSDVKDSFLVSLVSVLTPMGTWQDTILNFFVTIILKMFTGLLLGLVAVHGLFSCGTTAQLLHGLWGLSSLTSGIEPVSPAAQAGLLATG